MCARCLPEAFDEEQLRDPANRAPATSPQAVWVRVPARSTPTRGSDLTGRTWSPERESSPSPCNRAIGRLPVRSLIVAAEPKARPAGRVNPSHAPRPICPPNARPSRSIARAIKVEVLLAAFATCGSCPHNRELRRGRRLGLLTTAAGRTQRVVSSVKPLQSSSSPSSQSSELGPRSREH